MRKREKAIYIAAVAAATALFTVTNKPSLHPHAPEGQATDTVDSVVPYFRISAYDSIFQQYADTIGWDWKMLAAVAYVESKFDTSATSGVNGFP